MNQNLKSSFAQRLLSTTLAAVLTVAMLGGIDQLSLTDTAAAGWASQTRSANQG